MAEQLSPHELRVKADLAKAAAAKQNLDPAAFNNPQEYVDAVAKAEGKGNLRDYTVQALTHGWEVAHNVLPGTMPNTTAPKPSVTPAAAPSQPALAAPEETVAPQVSATPTPAKPAKPAKPAASAKAVAPAAKATSGKIPAATDKSPVPPQDLTGQSAWDTLAAEFPAEAAFAATDPKLKDVFTSAMAQHITDATKFTALLRQQYPDFLQTHGQDTLAAENARLNAWSTYANNYNQLASYINSFIQTSGLTIDPKALATTSAAYDPNNINTYQMPTENPTDTQRAFDSNNLIKNLLNKYYTKSIQDPTVQTDIKNQIRALHDMYVSTAGTQTPVGDIANNIDQLKLAAQQYGIGALALASDPTGKTDPYTYNATNIANGTFSLETAKAQMKAAAMNAFPGFRQQISDGALVSDLAAPYTNMLAQTLEVSPSSINLSETTGDGSKVARAMYGNGTTPTTLWDFQKQLYQDPRWLYTKNANDTIMGGANQLLSAFNFRGA